MPYNMLHKKQDKKQGPKKSIFPDYNKSAYNGRRQKNY